MSDPGRPKPGPTLDPENWSELRALGHRMLDDVLDQMARLRERPVWTKLPDEVRASFREKLPTQATPLDAVYRDFQTRIQPYSAGNTHPRFMGWVQGGGTAIGALAEMLAAGMNANCGGRDHAAIEVERQIARWSAELFGFPETASGIFVTGTSMANFIAVRVACTASLGAASRRAGIAASGQKLTAYVSTAAHGCIRQAVELAGFGSEALRLIPTDSAHRIDLAALRAAIASDRAAGATPFFLVGNAGTVDTGSIDDLDALASAACDEKLWFHIDGALGALAMLSPELRVRFKGIERADSIAFDFHKWLHAPYDAGCVLVRDGEVHRATFASTPSYLTRMPRGLAAATPWFTDYTIDLSRSFRALKVWFVIKEHGSRRLGEAIEENVRQARRLGELIDAEDAFELLAPVQLNIVCFRYRVAGYGDAELDRFNDDLVIALQESGIAVTSSTTVANKRAIRVNITNHRTRDEDLSLLLDSLKRLAGGLLRR